MQLCNITPTPLLKRVLDADETMHLVITSKILNDDEYLSFYRSRIEQGDFVILDTDAHELKGQGHTALSHLVAAAKMLEPHEIVLPDVYGPEGVGVTIDWSFEAAEILRSAGYNRFMIVPHGGSWGELLVCLDALLQIEAESLTIGVYEETEEDYGMRRAEVMHRLLDEYEAIEVDFHLLGMQEDMHDLLDEKIRDQVRSCDSCKLVRWGLVPEFVDPLKEIPSYPGRGGYAYFDRTDRCDDGVDSLEAVEYNIRTWREFMKGARSG